MVPSTFTADRAELQIADDEKTIKVALPLSEVSGLLGPTLFPPELFLKVTAKVDDGALGFLMGWKNDTLAYYNTGVLAYGSVSPYRKGKIRLFDATSLVPDECFWLSSLTLIELGYSPVVFSEGSVEAYAPLELRALAKDLEGPFMVTEKGPVLAHKDSGLVWFKAEQFLAAGPPIVGTPTDVPVDYSVLGGGGPTGPIEYLDLDDPKLWAPPVVPMWDAVAPSMESVMKKKSPAQLTEKGLETLKKFGVKPA